jgi:hypothetical protein
VKLFRIALLVVLTVYSASAAWAQYGLYGSPETLRIPQTNAPQGGTGGNYAVPATYPDTATVQQIPPPPAAPVGYGQAPVSPAPALSAASPQAPITPIPAPAGQKYNGYGAVQDANGPYRGAMDCYERAACGQTADNCGSVCSSTCCCPWYASLSGLMLGRSESRRLWTTHKTGEDTDQMSNSQFGMQWKWGGEIRFGRRFCCECVPCAVEATYWSTESFYGMQSTINPDGTVSTPLIIKPLTFGNESAEDWFDGAGEHRLWRRDEVHNIEINFIREQLAWAYDSPWDIGWSVGARYFRFQENLTFGSLREDHEWGEDHGKYEAYFSDTATNNLIGLQVGFDAAYNVGSGVRFFVTPKAGIYCNCMDSEFQAHTGDGINGHGPYGYYPVHATKGGVAFLTQIDVGADWQISRNWGLRVGYRAVAITGLALADDQFPQYMADTLDLNDIQHTGSLLLHGAFAGVTYNF